MTANSMQIKLSPETLEAIRALAKIVDLSDVGYEDEIQEHAEDGPSSKTALVRTQIRLPPELHASLVRAARNNRRSLNAEMVARLERQRPAQP